MKLTYEHGSQSFSIDLVPAGKTYYLSFEEKTVEVEILHAKDGKLELLLDGKRLTAYVSSDHGRRWVTVGGHTLVLTKTSGSQKSRGVYAHPTGELSAPMPGQVRAVHVSEGQAVTRGQTLLLLEAMKMEIRVQARMDGVVRKLLVKQGQTVERDQALVEIEEN